MSHPFSTSQSFTQPRREAVLERKPYYRVSFVTTLTPSCHSMSKTRTSQCESTRYYRHAETSRTREFHVPISMQKRQFTILFRSYRSSSRVRGEEILRHPSPIMMARPPHVGEGGPAYLVMYAAVIDSKSTPRCAVGSPRSSSRG